MKKQNGSGRSSDGSVEPAARMSSPILAEMPETPALNLGGGKISTATRKRLLPIAGADPRDSRESRTAGGGRR
jgi:hypothetical protein